MRVCGVSLLISCKQASKIIFRPPEGAWKGPRVRSSCRPDSQTFGGLRTPACGRTPTGAGPTASPRLRRGFGHLLTVIAGRIPAPSRDAATSSSLDFQRQKNRPPGRRWAGVKGGPPGRAKPLPLMPAHLQTRLEEGGGVEAFSTPPPDDRGRSAGFGAAPQGLQGSLPQDELQPSPELLSG